MAPSSRWNSSDRLIFNQDITWLDRCMVSSGTLCQMVKNGDPRASLLLDAFRRLTDALVDIALVKDASNGALCFAKRELFDSLWEGMAEPRTESGSGSSTIV